MKRVAIYCRVSSDNQKERETIENQVETLETYIEMNQDLKLVNKFLDDGISGTILLEDRIEGKKLITAATNHEFDSVLVYKVDRFGRDTLTGLQACEMLRKYNVDIISYSEPFDLNTPIGRYQFTNYLNMAELERNNILDRMYIGATRAAKAGKWLGGIVPYGYFKNKDNYLEVNENEAIVVRKIYDMYINDRMPVLDITLALNSYSIDCNYAARGTGKRNKEEKKSLWSPTTVSRILTSSTYKGIHEYGKRGSRRKETILREVPCIVPLEVWDQAQSIRKQNAIISKRNSPNRIFLLRTLIKCSECGRTYYGIYYAKKASVYCCSGKKTLAKSLYGIKCTNINVPAECLEEYVWDMCKEIMNNYDEYTIADNNNDIRENYENEKLKYEKKLISIESEKNNILKLYRKDIIDENDLATQLADIKNEISRYSKLIKDINDKLSICANRDELSKGFKSTIKYYKDRINDLSTDDKMKVIRLLVKEILVSTEYLDGKKVPKYQIEWNLSDLVFARTNIKGTYHYKIAW